MGTSMIDLQRNSELHVGRIHALCLYSTVLLQTIRATAGHEVRCERAWSLYFVLNLEIAMESSCR